MKDSRLWPSTDSSLLRSARQNDTEAWDQLCTSYRRRLFAYVRRRGMSTEDAEEVVQDAFTQLFLELTRGRFNYQRSKGKFRGFIAMMARQSAWAKNQKNWSAASTFESDEFSVTMLATNEDVWPQMEELIESVIPEIREATKGKAKQIIELHWYEAKSHDEIAATCGESNGYIAKVIFRFRKALLERMLKKLGDNV